MDTSVAAAPTATVIAVNNPNSNNSSIGNSSSNSSGYGSTTTTPTTPLGSSNYESQTPTPNVSAVQTAVADSIPVATVAAVTPFYNEAITAAQTHHRQQYYQQSNVYPSAAGAGGAVQTQPLQQYNVYDNYMGTNNYQHAANVERTAVRHAYTSHAAPIEKLTAKLSPNLQHAATLAPASTTSNNVYKHETLSSGTTATTKPQATATAFYAQPLHAASAATAGGGGGYFDPYKYKMPTKLPNSTTPDYSGYGSHHPLPTNAVAASYQQQYYAAAKSQLQEATYATAAVKSLNSATTRPPNISPYYGSSNNAYYDKFEKYMYTPTASTLPHATQSVNAVGAIYPPSHPSHPPPPHHFSSSHETPTDPYRKTATAWHWNMEYSAGNCRSLPPAGGGIPTATVSPTNTTYYPQASATARDAYYAHEKYAKYDKYGPYYHQQYMPTPPTTRNAWPNAHVPHLASQITERLQHSHPPPLQHSHSAQHYAQSTAPVSTAVANVRQNCCSQPPYQQQSCFYPRAPAQYIGANAYPAPPHPQQSHFVAGVSGNSKYGNLPDYPYSSSKLKNSNDLYVSSPFDTTSPAHLNYNYAPSTSQRYSLSSATTVPHQSLNPAATHGVDQNTAYYNDLNLHTTYDNYTASIQQQQHHQHHIAATRTQHHLPPPPYLPPNHGKPSLLDYRKPTTTQNTDCYITQSAISNLEDHVTGNSSYPSYDLTCNVNTSSTNYSNDASVDSSSDKSGTTKNLNVRDFFSTWNEDEDEYGAGEQLDFVESDAGSSKHAVNMMSTEISHKEDANLSPYLLGNEVAQPQQVASQPIAENHSQFKGSFNTRPKIHVGISVDSTVDIEANQYINLPDIIIDIEKSNNAGPTITANAVSGTKAINLENFDVEKELDELQIKKANKSADKQLDDDLNSVKNSQIIEQTEDIHCEFNIKEHLQEKDSKNSFDELQTKQLNADETVADRSVHILKRLSPSQDFDDKSNADLSKTHVSPVQTAHDTSFDNPEQFLKDIEYDNTSHSNESTFEKEYETFINKIGSDTEVKHPTKSETKYIEIPAEVTDLSLKKDFMSEKELQSEVTEDNKSSSQDEFDFSENVKEFSKFYKRKRKLIENNIQEGPTSPKQSTVDTTKLQQEKMKNFPKVYTKISRKRKKLAKQKAFRADVIYTKNVKINKDFKVRKYWNHLSQYYKILRSLRRFRFGKIKVDTSAMVGQHIAMLRERHLPLIKRQSVKQYLPNQCINFSPKTLKCLSVSIVNTEQFRQNILKNAGNITQEKMSNIDLLTESDTKQLNGQHLPNDHIKYVEKFAEAPNNSDAKLNKIHLFQNVNSVEEDLETISTNNYDIVSEKKGEQLEFINTIITKSDIHIKDQNNEPNVVELIDENIIELDGIMSDIEENQHKSEVSENKTNISESTNKMMDIGEIQPNFEVTDNVESISPEITENILEETAYSPTMDKKEIQYKSEVVKNEANISESTNKMMNIEEIHQNFEVTENVESISTEIIENVPEKTYADSPTTDIKKIQYNSEVLENEADISESINKMMDIEKSQPIIKVTKFVESMSPKITESIFEKTDVDSPIMDIKEIQYNSKVAENTANFSDSTIKMMDIEEAQPNFEVMENVGSISSEIIESNLEKNDADSPSLFTGNINLNAPINLIKIDENSISTSPEISEMNEKNYAKSPLNFTDKIKLNSAINLIDESSSSSSDSDSSNDSHLSESTSSSDDETASSSTSEASDFNELEALERELSQQRPFKDFSNTSDTIANKTDDKFSHETSEFNKTKNNAESVETFERITNNDIAHVKKMLESDHEEPDVERNTTFENDKIINENISSNLENDNFTHNIHNSTAGTITAAKVSVEDLPLLAAEEMADAIMLDNFEPIKINDKTYDVPSLKLIVKAFLNYHDPKLYQCETEQPVNTTLIPKLSDLCKIALNSSFESSEFNMNTNESTTQQPQHQVPVECRELSVEEALAEMYRQAGVASDPEDYEQDEKEAQDVLLINLEEILDSDSDLYVLQCDMNENILGVVTHSDAETESENTERVNTLQLVEILNSTDFDRNENELQLFNANDNFIMFSNNNDDDDDVDAMKSSDNSPVIIEENNDSLTSQFDLPTIHHEEIVPDNYKKFEKEQFLKYLHEKYVQKNISKFYHANRILKKYKRRLTKNFLKNMKTQLT